MKLIYNNICHFNLYKQRSKGTNKNKKKISMNNIKNLKNNKKKKNDQKKLNINNFQFLIKFKKILNNKKSTMNQN